MKFLMISFLMSGFAFAEDVDSGKLFSEHKQNVVSHIDERINQLTKAKGCFNGANKPEEMKKCTEELKSGMQEIKTEWKEDRKDMREKREELREAKKAEKMKMRDEMKKLKGSN